MSMLFRRETQSPARGATIQTAMLSDPGCRRRQNQDAARIVEAGSSAREDRGLLLVVADGMGGHEAGEIASQAAVEVIEQQYRDLRGTPGEALEKAFRAANAHIFRLASSDPAMKGMGTTCTALALVGGMAWSAHVGDTRLYLARGEGIYQLSEDQTQCMHLVRRGVLTLAEARQHEDRNVLIQAMGTHPELQSVCWPEPLPVRCGDIFVLCTDGLYDLVDPAEIRSLVRALPPGEACRRLTQVARARGGYDNITVLVAAIAEEGV